MSTTQARPHLASRVRRLADEIASSSGTRSRNRRLLCWCPQPGPCHAYVIARMADSSGELDHG